jgi:hypothetical protein
LGGQTLLNSRVIDVPHIDNHIVTRRSTVTILDDDDDDDDGGGDDDVDNVDLESAISEGIRTAHPNAIWVVSTHNQIKKINSAYLQDFVDRGKTVYRVIANHVGNNIRVPPANAVMQKHLYSVKGSDKGGIKDLHLTHMDLCVGTRVRITENICVEAGIFNGAMGTIKGFVYTKGEPPSQVNTHAIYIYSVFLF